MNYLIYAFYDRDGCIDFHVLNSLHKYSKYFSIIFVSNIKLTENEKRKISFVDHIIEDEHEEKDFGSWKIGLDYLKKKKVHNLVLTNDSIVGPYFKITEVTHKRDLPTPPQTPARSTNLFWICVTKFVHSACSRSWQAQCRLMCMAVCR